MPKKAKQSLQNVFVSGDGFVTKTELSRILKQVYVESVDPNTTANLEVFEVIELETPKVKGRYVFSNQRESVSELVSFLPATSNITQPPLVGELWLGFRFKKEHFYISRLSDSNMSVNYQSVGQSTPTLIDNKTNNETLADVKSRPYGSVFKPNISVSNQLLQSNLEGQTLIQGRYNNYIQLGAKDQEGFGSEKNYIKLSNQETYIDMENSLTLRSSQQYSELLDMNYDKTSGKVSRYLLGKGKEDKPYLDLDWEGPTLWGNSGRVLLTASEDDVAIFAKKSVRIKGERVQIANSRAIEMVTKDMVTDYVDGAKKDLNRELNKDIKLLPKNSIEYAKQMAPFITYIQGEIQAMAYLLLPPTLPGGIPNPSFMLGMKLKFETLQKLLKTIKEFLNLDFLPKFDFETISMKEFIEALGLNNLSIDFPVDDWNAFFDDIEGAKEKVLKAQSDAEQKLAAVKELNAVFDAVQRGGGEPESILGALDTYEADTNNTPIDTTDIRAVIADGADGEAIQNYLNNGGSPEIREALQGAVQAEQESQQLNQLVKIAELTKSI